MGLGPRCWPGRPHRGHRVIEAHSAGGEHGNAHDPGSAVTGAAVDQHPGSLIEVLVDVIHQFPHEVVAGNPLIDHRHMYGLVGSGIGQP